VLLVTADQMRGDCLGCAGHPVVRTPHLDQLALEGVRFTRAYSETPVCTAARHTLMTGLHPRTHGMPFYKDEVRMPDRPTLPALLGRAGYQTQAVGKMHFFPQRACYGFDHMVITEEGRCFAGLEVDDYQAFLAKTEYAGLSRGHGIGNNEPWAIRSSVPEHLSVTHWTVDECIEFLRRRDPTRPFFLWCSFTKPHPPFDPPEPYDTMYAGRGIPAPARGAWSEAGRAPAYLRALGLERKFDLVAPEDVRAARAVYYGLITQIDHQLGRLFGALRRHGLWNDTWVLFTADHGDMMGDHRLFAKSCWLEGSARVPFIIRPPNRGTATYFSGNAGADVTGENGVSPQRKDMKGSAPGFPDPIRAGAECRASIALADVMPTLLAMAGVTAPSDLDGASVLPLLSDPDAKWRPFVHGEYTVDDPGSCYQAMTDGRQKYFWYPDGNVEHLFDLDADPLETRNLSKECSHAAALRRWRARLVEFLAARGETRFTDGRRLLPASGPLRTDAELRARNTLGWVDV
jgi:arylsulfatase